MGGPSPRRCSASPTCTGTSSSWTTLDETEFGSPEMRYAAVSTLLTDGERDRSVRTTATAPCTLRLYVNAGTVDATATEMQNLVRELDRPDEPADDPAGHVAGVLPHLPVPVGELADHHRRHRSHHRRRRPRRTVRPGLSQTPAVGGTLDTDPANANGCFLDVDRGQGRRRRPRRSSAGPPPPSPRTGRPCSRSADTEPPQRPPFLFQAENQTNGTDTADQANASFSGAATAPAPRSPPRPCRPGRRSPTWAPPAWICGAGTGCSRGMRRPRSGDTINARSCGAPAAARPPPTTPSSCRPGPRSRWWTWARSRCRAGWTRSPTD